METNSALCGSAGQAHADCRGVPASFRATCVQDDVATYLSDLAAQGVPGSDQDHLNEGLQVCAGQPGPSALVANRTPVLLRSAWALRLPRARSSIRIAMLARFSRA